MSAIDLLESQHREVEKLFSQIEKAKDSDKKMELFEELADKLAIHAAIEEHHFYPAVKEKRTEDILLESLEEHVTIKRTLADLMRIDADDETFDAKMTVLKEEVEHHVEEEESELFPKVKKLLAEGDLDLIEQEMMSEQEELMDVGEPRASIPGETGEAAPLS
jgi:hemerythrin superfamily protein